ncbi:polyphosphate kinase [Leptolinea tardivitalis]|uniref:Polyphosphate kinase n=2 Tax=Leptolinea tardivitalis TaxID=229920 RepID=A0A0P6WV86_9CHLR|nr:polyphosphate kinase [Leptolinea tardivitalis]
MDRYRIEPGKKFKLSDYSPDDLGDFEGKKQKGNEKLAEYRAEIDRLQELLYCEHKHRLLVVFQAMDGGGKDGTVRAVFDGVNPQGVRVTSFKVPTEIELDHDYLWRIHAQTPGKGEIVVFNRSHYEDVLVVRVHNLVPKEVWKKRYKQINDFEQQLAEEGTTILKFFLNISLDEQKERMLERLEMPEKRWKFNPGDLDERKLWPEYMSAFEDAIEKTSTKWAPWYVIPANRNWYRNLVVASVIADTMRSWKMQYPDPQIDVELYKKQLMES